MRYFFVGSEWKDASLPVQGTRVDFVIQGNDAVSIYVASFGPATAPLSMSAAGQYSGYYRSFDEATVGGVCAGLAHKWGITRGGLQVSFVLAGLFTIGILAYLVCWLTFPALLTRRVKPGP